MTHFHWTALYTPTLTPAAKAACWSTFFFHLTYAVKIVTACTLKHWSIFNIQYV
jgi:hypothetical protein